MKRRIHAGDRDLSVAVLGLGRWGRRLVNVVSQEARLAVCCNRRGGEGHAWLRENHPGVRAITDVQEALAPEIDAVFIATPTPTHAELCLWAIRAGKAVFVEKPLAASAAEAGVVVEEARRRKITLGVGHVRLYDETHAWLKARTAADPVARIRCLWRKLGTFDEPLAWTLLPHEIATCLDLMGSDPDRVEVTDAEGIVTSCDRLALDMTFPQGQSASISLDRCAPQSVKAVSVQTRSGRTWLWEGKSIYELAPGGALHRVFEPTGDALWREVRSFLESVKSGQPLLTNGEFGLRVVDVMERVYKGMPSEGVR